MTDQWYELVDAGTRLTQDDLIRDCPLIAWQYEPVELHQAEETEILKGAANATRADVVVMTQACDLEYDKVPNVVLCPHVSLVEYRAAWDAEIRRQGQNPTEKAWKQHFDDIREGFVWNLSVLRYDYIPRFRPPNVEALVRRGVGFRNAVTANCIAETGPGFACLSTGVYVKRHGICTSRLWFDKTTRAPRYFYDEATGHVHLDAPTLTEMWKAKRPQASVAAVCTKDR